MKILGIDFVPLNVPLKDRLEVLAAGSFYVLFMGLPFVGLFITIYILFFTKLWPFMCVYLFWIWVIDTDVINKGGRPSNWVRKWSLFKYAVNYFPITVKAVPGYKIDPKRNYICSTFPHGYLPIGSAISLITYACDIVNELFPFSRYGVTLKSWYYVPIVREYFLALGICNSSAESINWILSKPGGGNIIGISVGGVAEAFFCQEGEYRLVLKNRKGFIKLALKNGAGIVPAFAFGQNSCFKLVRYPEGSFACRVQDFLKRFTGIAFPVIYGRGLFQYTFGFLPLQKPIKIIVGFPIDVPKIEEPTQEDIDRVHEEFIKAVTEIFNKYKYECEDNPEKCSLIIS